MLDYTLFDKSYILSEEEVKLLNNHPPNSSEDWKHPRYEQLKKNIKAHLIYHQLDRCAFCRKILESDGKYEPLDHVVPKTLYGRWIFTVKNLILTCESCNNLKSNEQTLDLRFIFDASYPNHSSSFIIFNPHYDIWSDHLHYENDIFIVARPKSKGKETIRICKLYRYNVILNRAKELKIGHKDPAIRIMHRLVGLDISNPDYIIYKDQFLAAVDHFLKRVEDNPKFL